MQKAALTDTQEKQEGSGLLNQTSPLTPVFRRAAQRDIPRIMEIFTASFKGQVPEENFPAYARYFSYCAQDLRFNFTVATLGKDIAGFALVNSTSESGIGNLDVIGVDPAFQGNGIGRGLMAEAEAAAARFNFPRLQLEVRENNTQAIGFYEKLGYYYVGTFLNYYIWDGVNGLVMEKQIASTGQDNKNTPATPTRKNPQLRR